jgi:hypothetical protein
MIPAPAGEEPEQGRGQLFVPLFSGRRVLVVVFNELRSIELDPAAALRSAGGNLENHDPRRLSMRRYEVLVALVRTFLALARGNAPEAQGRDPFVASDRPSNPD